MKAGSDVYIRWVLLVTFAQQFQWVCFALEAILRVTQMWDISPLTQSDVGGVFSQFKIGIEAAWPKDHVLMRRKKKMQSKTSAV